MQWLLGWGKSHVTGGHIHGQAGNILMQKGNEANEPSNVSYRKTWTTASSI
jgi:hypothetical protein